MSEEKILRKIISSAHGFDWCRIKNRKKARKSRTPGKTKVLSCQATVLDRHFTKRSRAYKHKSYSIYYKNGNNKKIV